MRREGALRFRVLGSGSTGNATLVECGATRLLLDAGLGPREMAERLSSAGVDPASLAAVVLSHEHGDHARGAAAFSRKWGVPLFGSRGTYAAAGFGAEAIPAYRVMDARAPVAIGDFTVTGIPVPHDAAAPYAFVLAAAGCRLGHATDLGRVSAGLVEAFLACDAVLVEANHDPDMLREGPYPWSVKSRILGPYGHLSNEDVAGYVMRGLGARCRTLVLAHLSRSNNRPDLAMATTEAALHATGRQDVRLELCTPEGTGWLEMTPGPPAPSSPQQLRLW